MIRVTTNPLTPQPTAHLPTPRTRLTHAWRKAAQCGAACVALTLGACTLLPAPQALQTYALPTFMAPVPSASSTAWSLRVNTPSTTTPLDSHQVIVQHANASLASYSGIRWADRAPMLLRDRLTQYLSDSGLFTAVVSDHDSILPTDAQLSITLRSFQLIHTQARADVHIRMEAQLIDARGPRLIAHHAFAHMYTVEDPTDPDAVIAAFGHTVDALAAALNAWMALLVPGNNTP